GFNLTGRTNVTIKNVIVTGWQYGFYLYYSSNNTLTNNTAYNNYYGFRIYGSNNTLTNNTAYNNTYVGGFYISGPYNTLINNTANNNWNGFCLGSSSYNNLSENTALNNWYGFKLYNSSSNTLHSNWAINSTTQAYRWDNDSTSNDFTGSVAANYLCVEVVGCAGVPLQGVEVKVVVDGVTVYASPGFEGTNATTGRDGKTPWIIVPFQTCISGTTFVENTTMVTVRVGELNAINSPREVNMATSHTEVFIVFIISFALDFMVELALWFFLSVQLTGFGNMGYLVVGVIFLVQAVLVGFFVLRKVGGWVVAAG
ncbi:MAG: right-handed parallel beta-helix repeat-containing protein, partial [Candidatus Freyarchaeota archaeon]|nr:right-handed parallel beta-helix repeat-containing protein [Candidatus Jordarchaeia archaeon]